MSRDPDAWYLAGVWAWLAAVAGAIALSLVDVLPAASIIAASVALLVWLGWPHLALRYTA